MLRYRGPKLKTLETVKKLDAFPKVPETYTETKSSKGGLISLITFLFIAFLVFSEIYHFFNSRLEYHYEVDKQFTTKVPLNFDITVATPCPLIGGDILDVTGDSISFDQGVLQEAVDFDLSPEDELRRQHLVKIKNEHVKNGDIKKLCELVIIDGFNATKMLLERTRRPTSQSPNSCRFHGTTLLSKVKGNFHVVAGKPMSLFGGHAHVAMLLPGLVYNFSHRVDHLSFGDMRTGLVNTLDGEEKVTSEKDHIFQYYLNVVATTVDSRRLKTQTYQFSSSDLSRPAGDGKDGGNDRGQPGLFFKYDFSAVSVSISEKRTPLGHFFTRVCGIVGGVFATSCIVDRLAGIVYLLYCRGRMRHEGGKDGLLGN